MGLYKLPKLIGIDKRPSLGTRVNWNHPLSQGLGGAWLFNEMGGSQAHDVLGLSTGTLTNFCSWIMKGKSYGVTAGNDTTTVERLTFDRKPWANIGSNPFTLIAKLIPLTSDANRICSCGAFQQSGSGNNETALLVNWATAGSDYYPQFYVYIDGVGQGKVYQSVACPINIPVVLAGQREGTVIRLFRDGSQVATDVCGAGNLHIGSLKFKLDGIDLGATFTGYSLWEYIYFYSRILNEQEIFSIYNDPYQMFWNPMKDIYIIPTAAPAVGVPTHMDYYRRMRER